MTLRSGLAQLTVFAILGVILAASIGGLVVITKNTPQTNKPAVTPTPTSAYASPSATPTITPQVQQSKLTPVSTSDKNTGTITNHVEDYITKNSIPAGDFILRIDNKATGQRFEQKGAPADLSKSGLTPGSYRISVYYPSPFHPKSGHCDGCVPTWGNINESSMVGYEYDLKAGETIRFTTSLELQDAKYYEKLAAENPANQSKFTGEDKEAPKSNVFYPQNGGTMTYKYNGKYCVVMNPPTDNKDAWGQLEFQYRFDNQSWSPWIKGEATFCTGEFLSNGSHTYEYHYKDTSGNEESVQKLSFTVNIPGN